MAKKSKNDRRDIESLQLIPRRRNSGATGTQRNQRLKSETYTCYMATPFVVVLVAFVVALGLMVTIQTLVTYPNRVRSPENSILPDVALEWNVKLPSPTIWHEVAVYGYIGLGVILVLLHQRRMILARRLLTCWTVLLVLRTLTIAFTSYPDPSDSCQGEDPAPVWWKLESCGDMMFSGHTTALFSIAYILLDAYPWFPTRVGASLLHTASAACVLFGALVILFTRLHYTDDVLVAGFLTSLVYATYYLGIAHPTVARTEFVRFLERDRNTVTGLACWMGLTNLSI